jgi:hypothetical protein
MAGRYQAVSIRARASACEAARACGTERFLSLEAPSLPLNDCSKPAQCQCRYRHHGDRRDEPRRDADAGLPGQPWHVEERRAGGGGRRATDRPAA